MSYDIQIKTQHKILLKYNTQTLLDLFEKWTKILRVKKSFNELYDGLKSLD